MKNWTEDKFLDYLLTSDFEDSLSPEDLKLLLLKFRYFYRIVSTRSNNIDIEKKRFDFEIEQLKLQREQDVNNLTNQKENLTNIYKSITTRKLSFVERLLGKIKPKPNEII
jgi:Ser-tRNA(Ala) deacylase AlaX